jgi:hypothetical protein
MLGLGSVIALASLVLPSSAAAGGTSEGGIDNHIACELIAQSAVKKELGVRHVDRRGSSTSPTSPTEPHTVDGGDASECDYFGFNHKPGKAEEKALRSARKPMPAGFGFLAIETFIRDPGPEGKNWDPVVEGLNQAQALKIDRKVLGGAAFESPGHGSFLHHSDWLGNVDRTSGFYEIENSMITLGVNSPRHARKKFRKLASIIVPHFVGVSP